jgi:hypothetical protein
MRNFGDEGFAFAGAALINGNGHLPAAHGARQDQPKLSGAPALLVGRLPPYTERPGFVEERLGLRIPTTRPRAETVPCDFGVRRRLRRLTATSQSDNRRQRNERRASAERRASGSGLGKRDGLKAVPYTR